MDEQSDLHTSPPMPAEHMAPPAHLPPAKFPKKKRLWPLILAGFVILAAVAAGVYWQFLRDKPQASDSSQSAAEQAASVEPAELFTTETEAYESSGFGLTITHPKDWTVSADASDQFSITSPDVKLADSGGEKVTGKVVLRVRNKQVALPELDGGNSLAAIDSEKISYTQPTASQRAQTYVSFLRYATNAGADTLDGLYITGDTGYIKGQAIPKADFVPVQPIISITFTKECTDCEGGSEPTSVSLTTWADARFNGPLRTMLQSITIR